MLTQAQNQPFKLTVNNLKKVVDCCDVQKEQDYIKSTLKTLTYVINLNELLKILLDSHHLTRLNRIIEKFCGILTSASFPRDHPNTYANLPSSPQKSVGKNKAMMLKHTKNIDLTPSTKKSRVVSTGTISVLLEDLIESLQKFDSIKHNSKRIKLLIEQIYDDLSIDEENNFDQDTNIETAWGELSQWKLHDLEKRVLPSLGLDKSKTEHFIQLLQQIQSIYKFMEAIKITTHDIFNIIEPESIDQQHNEDSYNLEAVTRKSNNPSEQRSLLTEMLRDSSQTSNIELPSEQNEYSSQVVLRPRMRFQEYSQNENGAYLDEHYKLSYKSAKPYEKSHKIIRSEMNYCGENDQNIQNRTFPIKRKQVKIKRTEMGCSRCEIF